MWFSPSLSAIRVAPELVNGFSGLLRLLEIEDEAQPLHFFIETVTVTVVTVAAINR